MVVFAFFIIVAARSPCGHLSVIPSMLAGIELPEPVVFTFTQIPETVFGELADQILWQRLIVRKLKEILRRLVLFELLAKCLQRRRRWREVAVCLARGEREHKSRLNEERVSPLDRLLRHWRDALEDCVQPAQMRLAGGWGSPDIFGDRRRTLTCHFFCLNDGHFHSGVW